MLEIFFSHKQKVKSFIIDEESYRLINNFNFTIDPDGYIDCLHPSLPDGHKRLHKLLMVTENKSLQVDHKNRNRTDNRMDNLRFCTKSQNAANSSGSLLQDGTSKYRGVHTYKRNDGKSKFSKRIKWRMSVKKDGKSYQKKCDFEIEAAIEYDKKVKELHGEFAILNFPTNESLMQACLELAQLKTSQYKEVLAPDKYFHTDIPRNGGSYGTPKPEHTGQMLQAYAQYLPDVLRATNSQAVPTAQATLAAEQATEPALQQLNTDLTREYAPQLSQINSDVQRQQALSGAQTQADTLKGPGGDAARAATALDRETNPDFYKSLDAASTKSADLLNSYDLNGLSPGEAAAAERSTNQNLTATGNTGNINPLNTLSNALQFGQAFDNKRAALNTAIGTANTTANTARNTGFSPVSVALSQPGTTGTTQFAQSGTGQSGSQGALSFGQGLLGNQFSQNSATIGAAASRANANSVPAYLGAMPSYS